jgi:hypothetical protein
MNWLRGWMVGAATLLSVSAAHADPGGLQPFRVRVEATETFSPGPNPGVQFVVLEGTGKGTHFGKLTYDATELLDFTQGPSPSNPNRIAVVTDGELVITAANGDQLFATYVGEGSAPGADGVVHGTGTAVIEGGTGRFACASGTVPFTVAIDLATANEVIDFDGSADLRKCK